MHGTLPTEEMEKTGIDEITAKAAAGLRPIVIDLAAVFTVPMFQKDATLVVRVDHVQFVATFSPVDCRVQAILADIFHAHINAYMSPHFLDELGLLGPDNNFPIALAAGAALATGMENGFQGMFINLILHYFSLLQGPSVVQRMIFQQLVGAFREKDADLVPPCCQQTVYGGDNRCPEGKRIIPSFEHHE